MARSLSPAKKNKICFLKKFLKKLETECKKSKFYFKVAKENGYDIGEIFDAYLGN